MNRISPENQEYNNTKDNHTSIDDLSSNDRRASSCLMHHSELSPLRRPIGIELMSPRNYSTPIKHGEKNEDYQSKSTTQSFTSYSFKSLPKFTTPPSRISEFVATNPFDAELRNKLHLPIFSPSVFQKCVSPSKESQESFCWTIDDLSRIHPAPIEEKFVDFDQVFSPDTESRTQQAIESYFCTTQVLQSPWPSQVVKKTHSLITENSCSTSSSSNSHKAVGIDLSNSKKEVWTQTVLSLPPILPASVEEALLPYFTFNQDQQQSNSSSEMDESYLNASTQSLRRRKLFQQEMSPEVNRDMSTTSVAIDSPARNGLLLLPSNVIRVQGSPVLSRSHGSPLPGVRHHQRSPSISPISGYDPISSIKIRSASARLDFSDEGMAVDRSQVSCTAEPADEHDEEHIEEDRWEESEENMVLSQTEIYETQTSTPLKTEPQTTQDPVGFNFSTHSAFGSSNNNQDTGYVTECNIANTTAYFKTPGVTCDFQTKRSETMDGPMENCTLWEPHSAHIVSSTPAKHTS